MPASRRSAITSSGTAWSRYLRTLRRVKMKSSLGFMFLLRAGLPVGAIPHQAYDSVGLKTSSYAAWPSCRFFSM